MKEFKGKSIIIAAPNHYGLLKRFTENLEVIGFTTIIIPDDIKVKIGLKNTFIHIYLKFVKGYKSFKKEKKIELRSQKQIKFIQSQTTENINYGLFIRPDLYSNELIAAVKKQVSLLCGYQWDGLDRFPEVYNKINLFDRFFVFDENDAIKNPKLIPITNFYFDDIPSRENRVDIYFVGSYMKNRIDVLLKLAVKFKEMGLNTSINLKVKSSNRFIKNNLEAINITHKTLSFEDNLINASQSRIILDFANNDVHTGISMRVFESIGLRKKLITNNPLVKKYNFYNSNNIFIVENDSLDGIENFMNHPYQNLPENVYKEYSFTNWIKRIFQLE